MNRLSAILAPGILLCVSLTHPAPAGRDQPFPEVKIGKQVWMSRNLDVDVFANGDKIPEATSQAAWEQAGKEGKPAWCLYDFNSANGGKYGKLYNWFAVTDKRGISPKRWRIPTKEEFEVLIEAPSFSSGKGLKGAAGWETYEDLDEDHEPTGKTFGNGNNAKGFDGLPGGYVHGIFGGAGKKGQFWSATPKDAAEAYYMALTHSNDMAMVMWSGKANGMSVRCIRE